MTSAEGFQFHTAGGSSSPRTIDGENRMVLDFASGDCDVLRTVPTSDVQSYGANSVLARQCTADDSGAVEGIIRFNIGEGVGVIAAQSIGEPGAPRSPEYLPIGGAEKVADASKDRGESYDGRSSREQ